MKVQLDSVLKLPDEKPIILSDPQCVIGRANDCDLQLSSPIVSRHHCEVLIEEDGVYVRDLGSSNGTFVNKERVTGDYQLIDGDILGVGSVTFRVSFPEAGFKSNLLARICQAFTQGPDRTSGAALLRERT